MYGLILIVLTDVEAILIDILSKCQSALYTNFIKRLGVILNTLTWLTCSGVELWLCLNSFTN